MRSQLLAGAFAVAAMTAAAAPVLAQPAPSCFFINQWDGGWRAPDDHTIFIRVAGSKIYRLDLSSSCSALRSPGAHLVTHNTNASICTALDWDLRVADAGGGFATPCIVKNMSLLSPTEAAALPPDARP